MPNPLVNRWHRIREWLNSSIHVMEILTLLILVTYITSDYFLWKQSNITERSLVLDQRPYVWQDNVKHKMNIAIGQPMWANLHLINYGKSPALKTRIKGRIFIGPNAAQDADRWFSALGDKVFTEPEQGEIVVPPGIPPTFPDNPDKATFGGGGFFTVMSEFPLTQPDVDYINTHNQSAVITARIQYFDGFGNRYWSDVCLTLFLNGNVPQCLRHNEMN